MRVRILSGNQAGEIQEVETPQGEHMVQFGFAELAPADEPEAAEHNPEAQALIDRSKAAAARMQAP